MGYTRKLYREELLTFTHSELCDIAAKWLQSTVGCPIVAKELVTYTISGETPDAIGWKGKQCILVECKTSRADFFADRKKPSRCMEGIGHPALGNIRVYIAPKGLIQDEEVPQGWGLYEVNDEGKVRYKAGVKYNNTDCINTSCLISERALLMSIIRRMNKWKSFIIRTEGIDNEQENTFESECEGCAEELEEKGLEVSI